MAALDPLGGYLRSNGGSPAPTTPRGQASKEVNIVIESIAQEFGLPLKSRAGTFSPSKRPDTYAERCIGHINYLYFRNRNEMYNVIDGFRREKQAGSIQGDLLEELYTRTRDAAYLEKHRPVEKLDLNKPAPEFKKPAPKLSLKQTQLIPQLRKNPKPNQPDKQKVKDGIALLEQPFVLEPDIARGTKRQSSQETAHSSLYVQTQKKRRRQPQVGERSILFKTSPSNPSLCSPSNQTHISSVFTQQHNQSFASTVATSFDGANDDILDESHSDYGDDDLDLSQVDRIMNSFEHPHTTETELRRHQDSFLEPHEPSDKLTDALTKAANIQLQAEHAATLHMPNTKNKGKFLEHKLVRSLPTDGLFGQPVPLDPTMRSFHLTWESYRVAVGAGIPFQYSASESELYRHLPSDPNFFQRTPSSVWEATDDPKKAANIIFKGTLNFNPGTSAEKLFTLALQPLKCERASRLQRKFGSSRFLYIEMPQIQAIRLPSHLNAQNNQLKVRFQEWMCTEKELLGRKWRVFHIQDIKKKHSKDNLPSQRLVLFAVDGLGLKPISLSEMLDWALSFSSNLDQGFCKLYARLDLFLSQTIPTVMFRPSQVKFVGDTKADGVAESISFNDPSIAFNDGYNPRDRRVMNDGYSLISVGAAKEICEKLEIKGVRPVAFQGRINGCKGVWSISAPYDTTSSKHLAKWIHISESQRKVFPRSRDLKEATCDPDRWSFELVKFTSSPRPSTLNLEFIPILENRRVPRKTLQQVIESQLELNFSDFLQSLDDPVQLRRWVHSEFGTREETNRAVGVREIGNFPADSVEKTILLLESGFQPTTSKGLAACVESSVKLWLSSMRQKLKIQLGKSTMVLGIADPTGCLKPGEIHMAFSETFRDECSGEVWPHLKGEVLVARHPSLRRSDMQKVKAVYKEELSHLIDVVVFPTKGCVPLAHKLQGGDYDGDTFWLCWDSRLTTDFVNAPAPLEEPRLEYFSIQKDKRSFREVFEKDKNVDMWLHESFKFKLQEDLLGKATNFHKKLAYKENSVSTRKVEALADLHDLVIDSAKNGYTFTIGAFNSFIKQTLGIKRLPDKPAYESWMEPAVSESGNNEGRLIPNTKHIIDYLLFQVVNPGIERFTKNYQEKLASAESTDIELEAPFRERQRDTSPIVVEVLKQLITDLQKVNILGNSLAKMTPKEYASQATRAHEDYMAILPLHREDSLIKEWLRPVAPHAFTTWEVIKASALYAEKHRRRLTLAFLVAGRELCYIKAMSNPGSRLVISAIHSIYKPRREKKAFNKRQAPLPVTESSETSEEEFFDAIS